MNLLGLAAILLAPSPQGPQELYAVRSDGDAVRVSANRLGVPADTALRELGSAVGWGVEFETEQLRGRMSLLGLDLAFTGQSPRTVAQLVAVAGGGDVVFDDRTELGVARTRILVVSPPAAATESGRQRLRRHAIDWYRTFLQDELRHDPLVEEEGMRARMQMAALLREQGELEEAASVFASVPELEPSHDWVPAALLRLAQCRFDLGPEHWEKAEQAARELTLRHPALPQAAAGTVLLGRILIARGRYEECVKTLTASWLRLAGTPEIVDLYLLAGEAEYRLGRPAEVRRAMDILDSAHEFRELDRRQWLDYLFLRGYALQELGEQPAATEALELFLGTGVDDPRRGIAFVILGRSYLAQGLYVQARAAAIEAHHLKVGGRMDVGWAREASKLFAKTALEIGDKDQAFDKLEVEVRRSPEADPELVLYLARAFLDERRYQKAIITCDLIADRSDDFGDQARLLRVEAMWMQAEAAGSLASFPERALPYAVKVTGTDNQRRVAETLGRVYEELGLVERAADAYRGMLEWR
jgi:tetratricopeptide (TPR) repeat protein